MANQLPTVQDLERRLRIKVLGSPVSHQASTLQIGKRRREEYSMILSGKNPLFRSAQLINLVKGNGDFKENPCGTLNTLLGLNSVEYTKIDGSSTSEFKCEAKYKAAEKDAPEMKQTFVGTATGRMNAKKAAGREVLKCALGFLYEPLNKGETICQIFDSFIFNDTEELERGEWRRKEYPVILSGQKPLARSAQLINLAKGDGKFHENPCGVLDNLLGCSVKYIETEETPVFKCEAKYIDDELKDPKMKQKFVGESRGRKEARKIAARKVLKCALGCFYDPLYNGETISQIFDSFIFNDTEEIERKKARMENEAT